VRTWPDEPGHYRPRNHPQQVALFGPVDEVDDWGTTSEFFGPIHDRYRFTIDVAAAAHNTKCAKYFDRRADGLAQPWAGERVWCNPPYSDIRPWVIKAWAEEHCPVIVMLLPANRTDQMWWHDLIEPFRDRPESILSVQFLPGRIRFIRAGTTAVGPKERPLFGVCLATWDREQTS
jgi:phage N-6-adenine-methyltransferase